MVQTNRSSGQSLQQILESVRLGLSLALSLPLSAKNALLVQQKLAALKYFASSFMKWKFKRAASQFSLQINIKKTECLYQPPKLQLSTSLSEDISISTEPLVKCKNFKYLESTVSENARLEDELSLRMGRLRASAVFGSVRDRLWNNRHVSIHVKCKVYRATVVATLLYGAETCTVYRVQVKKLQAYMMRRLRAIMNISWKDKITKHRSVETKWSTINGGHANTDEPEMARTC